VPSPLASIFSTIDSYKRRGADVVGGLLDDPMNVLRNQLADVGNASQARAAQTDSLYKTPEGLLSFDPKQWSPQAKAAHDALTQDALGAVMGATVYHGSPHRFDKFDSSKMGSGEGAQVYGHGLYFAESPEVARSYAASTQKGNFGFPDKDHRAGIATVLAARGEDAARKAYEPLMGKDGFMQALADARKAVDERASLYTVDLPDPLIARMLDWDKPLHQQTPAVQQAVADFLPGLQTTLPTGYSVKRTASGHQPMSPGGVPMTSSVFKTPQEAEKYALDMFNEWRAGPDTRGSSLLSMFDRDPAAAADMLQRAGVPGVRYRDQFSRAIATEPRKLQGSGQWSVVFPGGKVQLFPDEASAWAAYPKPTSNFVVFPGEEGALTILDRNSNFGLGPR
jgi:hypothetical protein